MPGFTPGSVDCGKDEKPHYAFCLAAVTTAVHYIKIVDDLTEVRMTKRTGQDMFILH
jgi:hypothetical protein